MRLAFEECLLYVDCADSYLGTFCGVCGGHWIYNLNEQGLDKRHDDNQASPL